MNMAKLDNPVQYTLALNTNKCIVINKIIYEGLTDQLMSMLYYYLFPNDHIYDSATDTFYMSTDVGNHLLDTNNIYLCRGLNLRLPFIFSDYFNKEYDKQYKEFIYLREKIKQNQITSPDQISTCLKMKYILKTMNTNFEKFNEHLFSLDQNHKFLCALKTYYRDRVKN